MKIERNITTIKTTTEEALESLRIYQQDMIRELWISYKKDHNDKPEYVTQSEFMHHLLAGPGSDWFQDLIEKYSIHWIDQPDQWGTTFSKIVLIIEEFPGIFFPGDALDEADQNTLFFLDHRTLSTKRILKNF